LVLPTMHRDLGLPERDLQWVLSAYVLTYGACLLPAGRFGDLRSRRGALLAGMALFAIGSLLCGLSGTEAQVIVSRALQGRGAAFFSPSPVAWGPSLFPEGPARTRALGAYTAWAAVGLGFGTLGGGLLTELANWRWVFLATGTGSVTCVIAIRLVVPADR